MDSPKTLATLDTQDKKKKTTQKTKKMSNTDPHQQPR